jgi:prolyl-tRNA synthetase
VAALAGEVEAALRAAGVRVRSDWSDQRPGFKYNHWELRGVPIRIEIGPRDAAKGEVVLVPRTDRNAKEQIAKDAVTQRVPALLAEIHRALYDQALAFRQNRTYRLTSFDEFAALMADRARLGFVEAWWCGDAACEAEVKAKTQATIRCLPLEQPADVADAEGSGTCIHCGKPGAHWAVFGKAY